MQRFVALPAKLKTFGEAGLHSFVMVMGDLPVLLTAGDACSTGRNFNYTSRRKRTSVNPWRGEFVMPEPRGGGVPVLFPFNLRFSPYHQSVTIVVFPVLFCRILTSLLPALSIVSCHLRAWLLLVTANTYLLFHLSFAHTVK